MMLIKKRLQLKRNLNQHQENSTKSKETMKKLSMNSIDIKNSIRECNKKSAILARFLHKHCLNVKNISSKNYNQNNKSVENSLKLVSSKNSCRNIQIVFMKKNSCQKITNYQRQGNYKVYNQNQQSIENRTLNQKSQQKHLRKNFHQPYHKICKTHKL